MFQVGFSPAIKASIAILAFPERSDFRSRCVQCSWIFEFDWAERADHPDLAEIVKFLSPSTEALDRPQSMPLKISASAEPHVDQFLPAFFGPTPDILLIGNALQSILLSRLARWQIGHPACAIHWRSWRASCWGLFPLKTSGWSPHGCGREVLWRYPRRSVRRYIEIGCIKRNGFYTGCVTQQNAPICWDAGKSSTEEDQARTAFTGLESRHG